MLNSQQTVANLVLDHSECAEVFQRHHIDFCCRGELTVEAAARDKGLALNVLIEELSRAVAERRSDQAVDFRELSTSRLVAHIVVKHHEYLRKVLPFVRPLAAKVSRVHGDHNPKLVELAGAVEQLATTLLPHLEQEEELLFPLLLAITPDPQSIERELDSMMDEHLAVAAILQRIVTASDTFTAPAWACNSYNTLLSELKQIEHDVFVHVHLENHVLRPRFVWAPAECNAGQK